MAFHCLRCHQEIDRSFKACPHCGEPITDFTREYADKPIDGKYRIVSRLGAGGMGDVYKVEHTFLGAIRVIKVVRPQILGTGDAADRFLREARLATKVHHANVATLHDFAALPDGSHYMVWEFIDGENLAQVLRRQTVLPARPAVEIIKQALAGLDAIHRAGIVHRDISPENLMISRDADDRARVKIIDLGVAKGDDTEGTMTKTGIFVGKLRYCSPEHLGFLPDNEKIDGRADLYSLAIVLVETLTGRPPFEATSPHQYIMHHSRDTELKSFDLAQVPQSLQPILARALERDRNKRYSTAREFAEALDKADIPAPIDADETMRLTPPPADVATIRTPLPIARTEIDSAPTPIARPPAPSPTPTPAPAPAPPRTPTVVTPVIGAATGSRSSAPLLIGVIIVLLIVIAAGAYIALHKPEATIAQNTTTQTVAPPLPKPQTTVEVTATTETAPTATIVTTTTQPPVQIPAPVPQPVPKPAPQPRPIEQPAPQPPTATAVEDSEADSEAMSFPTYREGGAKIANQSALNVARMQLHNVKEVRLTGGGPLLLREVASALEELDIAVVENADVAIHFQGQIDLGPRRRKRRSAEATIIRNGRPVLRYIMPPEEYRIGDNPAEAFGRVLSDLFER